MGSGFPMLSASRLENDTIINLKYWYLPIPRLKAWKGYWGGVTNLPRTFANAYAGGRDLALGFGGYYSICQPASCGPAIAAIHTPDILQDTLNDLLEVLRYVYPEAADRNGNYFAANENIWGYQPPNPWTGKFAYNSSCMTGVFVDLPDKKGYITFVKHNIGRIGYDWGGSVLDGHKENNWYFYDFKDLGEAALGNRAMGSVQPSSYVKIDYPAVSSATTVSGACFDPQTRIMYLYLTFALGSEPVVHAYHVKQSADARTEIMPPEKAGPVFVTQPNPFNPVTKIVLNSPLKLNGLEKAEIMIFNVRGKLVQRLLATNQQLSAGLAWDASNQPSGIYMLQVKIGGHLLMGRVSLIK
ncbi:MAG: hypothetical protein A2487_07855 [Candidatus Raymondbacteria bacterium RifOxyC12_full_50_8]|nr:MAG: hypothetical protein A2487_07855 [Candidatus Raymondbacteria bacterium RifOxyC12_full_50_8]